MPYENEYDLALRRGEHPLEFLLASMGSSHCETCSAGQSGIDALPLGSSSGIGSSSWLKTVSKTSSEDSKKEKSSRHVGEYHSILAAQYIYTCILLISTALSFVLPCVHLSL